MDVGGCASDAVVHTVTQFFQLCSVVVHMGNNTPFDLDVGGCVGDGVVHTVTHEEQARLCSKLVF